MTISAIIPVYNVEATLQRCVESVLNQSFTDWEMVLVDDGSTDGSGAICDQYAREDTRITVIHKENGGLSDARNCGLDAAQGEYVTFIDSDDYISADTFGKIMEVAHNHTEADVIEYPIIVHKGHRSEYHLKFDLQTYDDAKEYWIQCKAYNHTYACNKFFRRHLFTRIRFPKGKYFEDAWTLPLILNEKPVVMTCPEGMYYYCWNAQGISTNPPGDRLRQLLEAEIKASSILGLPLTGEQEAEWYLQVLNTQIDVYRLCGDRPLLLARKLPIGTAHSLPGKIKIVLLNILGIELLCKLYRLIKGKY